MGKGDDYQDMDETTYILDGRSQKPAKAERSSQMLSFFAGAPRSSDGHPSHSCAHWSTARTRHRATPHHPLRPLLTRRVSPSFRRHDGHAGCLRKAAT